MDRRFLLGSIGLVIFLPIAVVGLGASEYLGLSIGVALVIIGIGSWVIGSRREEP